MNSMFWVLAILFGAMLLGGSALNQIARMF